MKRAYLLAATLFLSLGVLSFFFFGATISWFTQFHFVLAGIFVFLGRQELFGLIRNSFWKLRTRGSRSMLAPLRAVAIGAALFFGLNFGSHFLPGVFDLSSATSQPIPESLRSSLAEASSPLLFIAFRQKDGHLNRRTRATLRKLEAVSPQRISFEIVDPAISPRLLTELGSEPGELGALFRGFGEVTKFSLLLPIALRSQRSLLFFRLRSRS